MGLDKYTIEQAKDHANNEAEIQGFEIGSPQWRQVFKEYCKFAEGTMSVGRNPRTKRNPIKNVTSLYPDIFASNEIAGRWAKNYQSQDGRGIPVDAVNSRIMSSVMNLVKLFENAELGTKNVTSGHASGKIDDSSMSELQLPSKPQGMSEEKYIELSKAVVKRQMTRDLLTNIVLESLKPFFEMNRRDVEDIMKEVNWDVKSAKEFQKAGLRKSWIEVLRGVIGGKFKDINIRKMILKS